MFILEQGIQDYCLCPVMLHNQARLQHYRWDGRCRNTWAELAEIIFDEASNALGYGVEEDWGIEVQAAEPKYPMRFPVAFGGVGLRLSISRIQMNLDTSTLILTRRLNADLFPERREAEAHIVRLLDVEAQEMMRHPLVKKIEVHSQDYNEGYQASSSGLSWEQNPDLYDEAVAWITKLAEAFVTWAPPRLERCGFCHWVSCSDRRVGNPIWSMLDV